MDDTRRFVTIASVWPLAVREERLKNIGEQVYEIPAAPKGEVRYLRVYDAEQTVYMGYGKSSRILIPAIEIAQDLIRCWTEALPLGGGVNNPDTERPGIWICAGSEATPEEVAKSAGLQRAFAKKKVLEADAFFERDAGDKIRDLHFRMAELIGVQGRKWQQEIDRSERVACPFCGHSNEAWVPKCPNCREVIDDVKYKEMLRRVKAGETGKIRQELQERANKARATATTVDDMNAEFEAVGAAMAAAEAEE